MRRGLTLFETMFGVFVMVAVGAIGYTTYRGTSAGDHRHPTCMPNLKHLGLGMVMYTADNDDRFPSGPTLSPGGAWGHAIYPYVKSVMAYADSEDATRLPRKEDWTVGATLPTHVYSYGMNSNLGGVEIRRGDALVRKPPVVVTKMTQPARTVLFYEVSDAVGLIDHAGSVAPDGSQYVEYESPTGNGTGNPMSPNKVDHPGQTFPDGVNPDPHVLHVTYATGNMGGRVLNGGQGSRPRHGQLANYAFADGHAKALRPERVSAGADAVAPGCDQGTEKGQTGPCVGQTARMSAGAERKKFDAVFSSR